MAADFLHESPTSQAKSVMKGKRIRNIIIIVLVVALIAFTHLFLDSYGHKQGGATDVIVQTQ